MIESQRVDLIWLQDDLIWKQVIRFGIDYN